MQIIFSPGRIEQNEHAVHPDPAPARIPPRKPQPGAQVLVFLEERHFVEGLLGEVAAQLLGEVVLHER